MKKNELHNSGAIVNLFHSREGSSSCLESSHWEYNSDDVLGEASRCDYHDDDPPFLR